MQRMSKPWNTVITVDCGGVPTVFGASPDGFYVAQGERHIVYFGPLSNKDAVLDAIIDVVDKAQKGVTGAG